MERDGDLGERVRAAQRGDPAAFEELVLRFREPLLGYATALLRDRGHAEDAVQEALLQAWRRLGTLRDADAFRPWIYCILENAAISGRRKRRLRRTFPLFDGEAVSEGGDRRLQEEAAGDRGRSRTDRVLHESLDALAEPYKDALRLRYVGGLSSGQVGRVLGITSNNAKVRLHRARTALRRELERRGLDGSRLPVRRPLP